MKLARFASSAAAVCLLCAPLVLGAQQDRLSPRSAVHSMWQQPPANLSHAGRLGYEDGITVVREDLAGHKKLDLTKSEEYQHPEVPESQWQEYRDGFKQGYYVGIEHMKQDPGGYN